MGLQSKSRLKLKQQGKPESQNFKVFMATDKTNVFAKFEVITY